MNAVYDEQGLIRTLSGLPAPLRVGFAALCAQRILPGYGPVRRASTMHGRDDLAAIMDRVWTMVSGERMNPKEAKRLLETTMALLPNDMADWADEALYAEDAVAAAAYALRALVQDDPQEAAWAARRCYEAMDQYALVHEGWDPNDKDVEQKLLEHPAVQGELRQQQDDLRDLVKIAATRDYMELERLRARAVANAHQFLDGASS